MGNPPPVCVATLTQSVRFIHLSTIDPHTFRATDKCFAYEHLFAVICGKKMFILIITPQFAADRGV